jgi:SAM-dependent methyltransferase
MMQSFKDNESSHDHSLSTLNVLNEYDSFMSSVDTVLDLGSGSGADAIWWATRRDPSPPHVPRNYNVIAVDNNLKNLSKPAKSLSNITVIDDDFDNPDIIKADSVDIVWAHNSFQYSKNPLQLLCSIKNWLTDNGMLYVSLPYSVNRMYNSFSGSAVSGAYFHYTPSNMLYMLAAAGFDCSDSRLAVKHNPMHFEIVAYNQKSTVCEFNQTVYDLHSSGLLPKSAITSIDQYGYINDLVLEGHWFDGRIYLFNKL